VLTLVCDHDSLSCGILLLQSSWNDDSLMNDANHSGPDIIRDPDAYSGYFTLDGRSQSSSELHPSHRQRRESERAHD
jgi:hypothetical protein